MPAFNAASKGVSKRTRVAPNVCSADDEALSAVVTGIFNAAEKAANKPGLKTSRGAPGKIKPSNPCASAKRTARSTIKSSLPRTSLSTPS